MGRLSAALPVIPEPCVRVRGLSERQLLEVVLGSPAEVKPCTRRGADRLEWLRPAVSRLADRRVAVREEMRARRLCAGCPVMGECLELALRGELVEGVQGGTTERSRGVLRRRRAVRRAGAVSAAGGPVAAGAAGGEDRSGGSLVGGYSLTPGSSAGCRLSERSPRAQLPAASRPPTVVAVGGSGSAAGTPEAAAGPVGSLAACDGARGHGRGRWAADGLGSRDAPLAAGAGQVVSGPDGRACLGGSAERCPRVAALLGGGMVRGVPRCAVFTADGRVGLMREQELPTWQGMVGSALAELDSARSALSDAAGWLRSDWRPVGSPLPDGVGTALREVLKRIGRLKGEIDQAKGVLSDALRSGMGGGAR